MLSGERPAIVLVHGGFSGGWCWERVSSRLEAAGYRVFAPTLTGLAERAHELSPEVDLSTHIADVVDLVHAEELDDFVLCGHSYGGMVISGAAQKLAPRIHALVYLDAVLPEPGGCLWDYLSNDQRLYFTSASTGLSVAASRPGPGVVAPAEASWLADKFTPHPWATFHDRLPNADTRSGIATNIYVRATGYTSEMLDGSHDRAKARGWICIELPFSHSLMIDAPDEIFTILETAAR